MTSSENIADDSMWVQKIKPNVPRSSMINLVNLLLRETSHRITVLERVDGPDPEIYVVTRVNWRDPDISLFFHSFLVSCPYSKPYVGIRVYHVKFILTVQKVSQFISQPE